MMAHTIILADAGQRVLEQPGLFKEAISNKPKHNTANHSEL